MKKYLVILFSFISLVLTLGFVISDDYDDNEVPFINPPIDLSWVDSTINIELVIKNMSVVKLRRKSDVLQEFKYDNKRYIIRYKYNLNGDTLRLGKNCCLDFKGGQFYNGVIVGDNTIIKSRKEPIFNSIQIQGGWNVPILNSSYFADAEKENVLIQLFNMTNDSIVNKVMIEEGNYIVRARLINDGILRPKSNTDLVLNGNILLLPNEYRSYQIMSIYGVENVFIHGKGQICGDLFDHFYDDKNSTHEWGHGLTIRGCKNVLIDGIRIKNCTGDACSVGAQAYGDLEKVVPTGTPSKNVTLRNCKFESARRQGLTITFASYVTVDNCIFDGIFQTFKGTPPGAAIDIEPDNNGIKEIERGAEVYHVHIKNSTFNNCRQGIISWKTTDENDTRWFRDLQVENCSFNNIEHYCFNITGFDNVYIRNSTIINSKNRYNFKNCKKIDRK